MNDQNHLMWEVYKWNVPPFLKGFFICTKFTLSRSLSLSPLYFWVPRDSFLSLFLVQSVSSSGDRIVAGSTSTGDNPSSLVSISPCCLDLVLAGSWRLDWSFSENFDQFWLKSAKNAMNVTIPNLTPMKRDRVSRSRLGFKIRNFYLLKINDYECCNDLLLIWMMIVFLSLFWIFVCLYLGYCFNQNKVRNNLISTQVLWGLDNRYLEL